MNKFLVSVEKANENLSSVVSNTPLQHSKRLSDKYKANIYIKREDLQEVRSFKIRGAYNKISTLSDAEKKRGVVCASAGNHAQGVALSCSLLKIKGTIFMPEITPNQKIEKVKNFGDSYITIQLVGTNYDETYSASLDYCLDNKAVYVHPFNDETVVAGQGTVAKEIYEARNGDIDLILVPVGGGGLISGVSSYLKAKNPQIKVVGCEPQGAPAMYESLKNGKVTKLAHIDPFVDGAAVMQVGTLTYKTSKEFVDNIILVPEGKICTTMIELYQNEGIITEPAGALSISGLDLIKDKIKGKTVVCILSGGNNDISRYPEVVERSLVYLGLKHYFLIEFVQKPGQLRSFLNDVLGKNDDIVLFEYMKKTNREKGPALVGIELKDKNDLAPLVKRLDQMQFKYKKIENGDLLYNLLI
jgi:threonine dehydratase